MWAVYILLVLLGLILAVLFVPVYGQVAYDGRTLRVRLRIFGIPVSILPTKEKAAKPAKKAAGKKKSEKKKKAGKDKPSKKDELLTLFKQDDIGSTVAFIRKLAVLAGQTVGRLLRSITVDKLGLQMMIAGGEPDKVAKTYGQVCGVLYPSLAVLQKLIKVRHREMRVEPNFLVEKGGMRCDVRFHVWVYRAVGAGIFLLVHFLKIKIDDSVSSVKEGIDNGQ